jgi:NADPH:quinone reductase-like Zn-dependent oxidoreductase
MADVLPCRGLCAIALAKAEGCHVTSTSRSAKSQDQLFAAGADAVLIDDGNLAAQLGDGTKFNKILELVGASTLRDSLACCARPTPGRGSLGLVCMIGFTGGQWWLDAGFEPMTDIPTGVALCGYSGGPSEFGRTPYEQLFRQIEEGKLKLPVARTLKLEEVQKAHEFMEKGGAGGKMVLLME